MDVFVLTATALEQETLRGSIRSPTTRTFAYRARAEGRLGTRRVALIETGIGAVNTAQALTAALESVRPRFVLQVGVGGAYAGAQLNVGDLAVATEENDGELGILARRATTLILEAAWPCGAPAVRSGPFVTVQQCSGLAARGAELAARYNAICENMEGAAAAQLCTLYEVPFVELRGISNLVEDRNTGAWKLSLASRNVQQAARVLMETLEP